MFFNFFRNSKIISESIKSQNKDNSIEENNLLARITYSFSRDSLSPIVDVEIKEYNEECIQALSRIVSTIAEENAYLETVDIIQSAMLKDKKENYFIELISNLTSNAKTKIIKIHDNNELDQPCIKPSDML